MFWGDSAFRDAIILVSSMNNKGGGGYWSGLEPKPKFGVTLIFKLNYFVPVFLITI